MCALASNVGLFILHVLFVVSFAGAQGCIHQSELHYRPFLTSKLNCVLLWFPFWVHQCKYQTELHYRTFLTFNLHCGVYGGFLSRCTWVHISVWTTLQIILNLQLSLFWGGFLSVCTSVHILVRIYTSFLTSNFYCNFLVVSFLGAHLCIFQSEYTLRFNSNLHCIYSFHLGATPFIYYFFLGAHQCRYQSELHS